MNNIKTEKYYLGTSGLLLPVPNKSFYPVEFQDKSRLVYYSSLMNSIEINSSFYKIPQPSTVSKWREEVGESFKFTFKLFKGITHQKKLAFDPAEISQFFNVINCVEDKKGCLLVQLPPSIRLGDFSQLRSLMENLHSYNIGNKWKIAVELRHPSLYVEEISELLTEFSFASVIHDKSFSASPMEFNDVSFVYLRFHGPGGNYKGSYDEAFLSEYASYIKDWMMEGKEVFIYFNNTMGNAHGNISTLQSMIKESSNIGEY
jgi:uncharacterized protein YecE (DUF72 family)